jgi:serine/threonine-protein kinase
MGEVYRANDSRLARDVALKVLPDLFARDHERMARFEREAKVLASLNHPHIAALYGFEESANNRALVMELIEGPTLAERIRQGPMQLDEVLPIAQQIADALEFAHERSIIHRDLKPANIKLTADGQVKLLDFGLAKALEGESAEEELQNSPTLTAAATRAGVLLGTAAYMSPEQARGKRVDRRADIWAFGCVLYEMLSGHHAFAGETTSDILAGVIRAEPDWSWVPSSIPLRIRELLRRCLQKDPRQRLRDIGEARITIEAAIAGSHEVPVAPTPAPRRALTVPWVITGVAVVSAVALAIFYSRSSRPDPHQILRASLSLDQSVYGVFSPNPGSPVVISPDGSHIVFVGSVPSKAPQLFLRTLDQQTSTPVPGTEGAAQPFFSPDGQWIGFFLNGKMRKVPLAGGIPISLSDAVIPHGASWATDGTIVYAPSLGSGLMRIPSGGGTPQTLTTPDQKNHELSHRWPQILPGNKAVLFTIQLATQSSYDEARIALLSLDTGKWRTLFDGGCYARYVNSGHIIYAHAGALMTVPFDLAHLQVTGPATPAQDAVITSVGTSGSAEYDISNSGTLVYIPGSTHPPDLSLVWVDRQGKSTDLGAPVNTYADPNISPDGKRVVVQILGGPRDLWIYDFNRKTLMRLTFSVAAASALWFPDNRRILYRTSVPGFSIRSKLADGSGSDQVLLGSDFDDSYSSPSSISPDGKTLLFGHQTPSGGTGTYSLSLDGTTNIQPFLESSALQSQARFSPDGHWVAYRSNESSKDEIYVQPFPGPGGKWMISNSGGEFARWSRDGREIFFRSEDKMMAVSVETQPTFKAGTPKVLFQTTGFLGQGNYDVAPDGQHFLLIKEKDSPPSSKQVNIVSHWTDELARRNGR